jgi:hypothetical protein
LGTPLHLLLPRLLLPLLHHPSPMLLVPTVEPLLLQQLHLQPLQEHR